MKLSTKGIHRAAHAIGQGVVCIAAHLPNAIGIRWHPITPFN